MIDKLWKWLTWGPRYTITIYFGVMYVFGVPILPLLDVTIEREDR